MTNPSPLNLDYVRSQFPGLSRGWTFFDNAGGSQILKGALDRINTFLVEKNVQIGGSYEVVVNGEAVLRDTSMFATHRVALSGRLRAQGNVVVMHPLPFPDVPRPTSRMPLPSV